MISIVIPTHKRSMQLNKLLNSIPDYIVGIGEAEVITVSDNRLSLAQKRNAGWKKASGKIILFIDDDNIIQAGSFSNLLWLFADKKVGVVGMTACYQNDMERIADGGSYRNYATGITFAPNFNKLIDKVDPYPYEVDEVANAFAVRKSVLEEIGGFDEERFPIDLDEADLCLRAKKAGYKVMMSPQAIVYHNSMNETRIPDFRRPKNAYFMGRNKILFQRKHKLSLLFVPMFVLAYVIALSLRGKFNLIKHYLKGARDGWKNSTVYPKEYQS